MEVNMKNNGTRLALSLLAISMVLSMGALGVFGGWSPPCRVADRLGYLSRSCASEQIQAAVGTKNIEVIEISGIRIAGRHERKVEFRSRFREPHDDDSANMVFVDSVTFRPVGHKWRLDSSTLHW
jgi:hypothetical protein